MGGAMRGLGDQTDPRTDRTGRGPGPRPAPRGGPALRGSGFARGARDGRRGDCLLGGKGKNRLAAGVYLLAFYCIMLPVGCVLAFVLDAK